MKKIFRKIQIALATMCIAHSCFAAEAATKPAVESPTQESSEKLAEGNSPGSRWYLNLGIGGSLSYGPDYLANQYGGNADVSIGYQILPRWSLGGFYNLKAGISYDTAASAGLISGGVFLGSNLGIETDIALLNKTKNKILLGARIGYFRASGISSIFFIPFQTHSIEAFSVAATASYIHYFSEGFGLGAKVMHSWILSPTYNTEGIFGKAQYHINSFSAADVNLLFQFRF